MKATIDILDPLFRGAKSKAAERGQTLKEFVAEAQQMKIADSVPSGDPEWMKGFGALRHLHKETRRIQARIDATFGVVEDEHRGIASPNGI